MVLPGTPDLSDEALVLGPEREGRTKAEIIAGIVETTLVDEMTAEAIYHQARGDEGYEAAPI